MGYTVLFSSKNGANRGADGETLESAAQAAEDEWFDQWDDEDDEEDPASVQIFEDGQLVAYYGASKGRIVIYDIEG